MYPIKSISKFILLFFISSNFAYSADPNHQALSSNRDKCISSTEGSDKCISSAEGNSVQRLVLPLDHGPRAVTTPWLNQQRIAAANAKKPSGYEPLVEQNTR